MSSRLALYGRGKREPRQRALGSRSLVLVAALLVVVGCSVTEQPHPITSAVPFATPGAPSGAVSTATAPLQPPPAVKPAPASSTIRYVHMVNAEQGWALASGAILRTTDGGDTWKVVSPEGYTSTEGGGTGFFLDADAAWVTDGDENPVTVLHTTDGGANWQRETVTRNDLAAYLYFRDYRHGWALIEVNAAMHQEWIKLYRTDDGGSTWTQISHAGTVGEDVPPQPGSLPVGGYKTGLTFLDLTYGWVTVAQVIGKEPILYVTRDGGATWSPVNLPAVHLSVPVLLSPLPPLVLGASAILQVNTDEPSALFYTTDDGTNWRLGQNLMSGSDRNLVASFADGVRGFATDGLTVFSTANGGLLWAPLSQQNPDALRNNVDQIDFVTPQVGWALVGPQDGTTHLLKTTDGGRSWSALQP